MTPDTSWGDGVSIIVPAHDEERTIGACLASLDAVRRSDRVEVIVAANGCADRTAEIARAVPGVRVLDLPEPSKAAALRAADDAAKFGARIYLDGDIVLTDGTAQALVDAVTGPGARIVAPLPRYRTDRADAPVRAYYAVKRRLHSTRTTTVGRGVFGVSAEGRRRIGTFEGAMADDLLAASHFGPEETVICPGESVVEVPRTVQALLAVRTRIAAGNGQIRAGDAGQGSHAVRPAMMREVAQVVKGDLRTAPAAAVFVAISLAARIRARRAPAVWHRDTTTR